MAHSSPDETFLEEALPHAAALYRTARSLTGEPTVAEDLVQETFQQAWKSFHGYQPETNCKAWLFRILFRVWNRSFRMPDPGETVLLEDAPQDRLSVSPTAVKRLEQQEILKILASLPDHYRIALVLADVENFSYREIADWLQVPVGTVMSRLNRARRLFRSKYREQESENRTA